jgi:hypothetical protein
MVARRDANISLPIMSCTGMRGSTSWAWARIFLSPTGGVRPSRSFVPVDDPTQSARLRIANLSLASGNGQISRAHGDHTFNRCVARKANASCWKRTSSSRPYHGVCSEVWRPIKWRSVARHLRRPARVVCRPWCFHGKHKVHLAGKHFSKKTAPPKWLRPSTPLPIVRSEQN